MPANTEAAERLERLLTFLERDSRNLRLRQDAVHESCAAGRWDTAQDLLETGLAQHPDDALLLALAGLAHLQAQRYAAAEQSLAAAIASGVESADVRYHLALACVMQGRWAEALPWLSDPVLHHAVAPALVLQARCLHHLQRPEAAIAACHARLAVTAEDAEAHGLLALLLYEQDRRQEASMHLETALGLAPLQLEALLARASLQSAAADHDAAARTFKELVAAHPQCGRGWLGLALTELSQLKLTAAKRTIEVATMYLPEHIGSWHVLAWTHLLLGEIDGAQQAFERALALNPSFSETHGGLAVTAALRSRITEARRSIKRAQRLDSKSLAAQYACMLLLEREGQHDAARAVMDELLAHRFADREAPLGELIQAHVEYLQRQANPQPSGRLQ